MQRKILIAKLNWFYSLELHQVDLYTTQAHIVEEIYLAKALSRFATIEQQHVDNIAEAIKQLGAQPIKLGDVISPILGKVAGSLTGLGGKKFSRDKHNFRRKSKSTSLITNLLVISETYTWLRYQAGHDLVSRFLSIMRGQKKPVF